MGRGTDLATHDARYRNKRVHGRKGTPLESEVGVVFRVSRPDGAGETRLHVRWSGGTQTYPVASACRELDDGDLEIK